MDSKQATRIHERYGELEAGVWFLGFALSSLLLAVDLRWLMLGGLILLAAVRFLLTHRGLLPPRPIIPDHDKNVMAWRWVCAGLALASAAAIGSSGGVAAPLLLMAAGTYLIGLGFLGGGRWRIAAGHLLVLGGLGLFMKFLPNVLVTYGLVGGLGLCLSGGLSLMDLSREEQQQEISR